MNAAWLTVVVVATLGTTGALAPLWTTGAPAPAPPLRLVAFGDSFTATGGPQDLSWATGDPGSGSIAERLAALHGPVSAYNAARVGWRMHQLVEEVDAAPLDADVVLVFLGINDFCWPTPTSLADFEAAAREGFGHIAASHPTADVVVFAIPDLTRFRPLQLSSPVMAEAWEASMYCRGVFGGATEETLREAAVRLAAMNAVLRAEARDHGFVFSAAMHWPGFTVDHLHADLFHPNPRGHALMAAAAWPAVEALGLDAQGRISRS